LVFFINGLGKLWAGSESCRLYSYLAFVFHGSKPANPADGIGVKGIMASGLGASIDIHGRLFDPTWTRLASTVYAGDEFVYLQRPVRGANGWEVGQEILVTTTQYKDEIDGMEHQNEVRVIKRYEFILSDLPQTCLHCQRRARRPQPPCNDPLLFPPPRALRRVPGRSGEPS
jgi:hypothetical protein